MRRTRRVRVGGFYPYSGRSRGSIAKRKFGWNVNQVAAATEPLWEIAHWVTPKNVIAASRDEADNRILECAVEAAAEVIVTNDNDLLVLNPFGGIYILRAHEFLAGLASEREG